MSNLNKRGNGLGEGIITIYRLVLLSFVALIILGLSSVFYGIYIDVRDAESQLLTRSLVDCISPEGIIDSNLFDEEARLAVLDYCGIRNADRFYVGVDVFDLEGDSLYSLNQGDKGSLWVMEFFDNADTDNLEKYNPGYNYLEYPVFVRKGNIDFEGIAKVEVLVRGDEE